MIIAWIPVALMVSCAFGYAMTDNGKLAELARIGFFVGLLFTIANLASKTLHIAP